MGKRKTKPTIVPWQSAKSDNQQKRFIHEVHIGLTGRPKEYLLSNIKFLTWVVSLLRRVGGQSGCLFNIYYLKAALTVPIVNKM